MIIIRPFEPGDLARIEPRAYEREMMQLAGNPGEQFAVNGPAFTMFDGDIPVMAAGVFILWPGVGEAWMHLSPWFYHHVKTAYESVYEVLSEIIINKGLRRVQTPICADMESNLRFVEHLGFKQEGLMRRWGPEGKDYVMCALVALTGESLCLPRR